MSNGIDINDDGARAIMDKEPKSLGRILAIFSFWCMIALILIFLVWPFAQTLIVPLVFVGKENQPETDVGNLLTGVTIFLALMGTAASIISIVMSYLDKLRYTKEQSQISELKAELIKMTSSFNSLTEAVNKSMTSNEYDRQTMTKYNDFAFEMIKKMAANNTSATNQIYSTDKETDWQPDDSSKNG